MRKLTLLCRIVDNLGDAGVALRFSRQWLKAHPDDRITLCTDQVDPYLRLSACTTVQEASTALPGLGFLETLDPADDFDWGSIVIEMFGTPVPQHWKARLARLNPPPAWVNLEYLSAEKWIEDCHGLWSTDPETGWKQLFFFPGFTEKSGGLLGEEERSHISHISHDTTSARIAPHAQANQTTTHVKAAKSTTTETSTREETKRVSHTSLRAFIFAYTLTPLGPWLEGASEKIAFDVAHASGGEALPDELAEKLQRVSFVPQTEFDSLLKTYDLLFVRGEDSFVRAQLAGIPMVWQIYPTADDAHWTKLDAFFQRYAEGLPEPARRALKNMWWYWNGAPLENINPVQLLTDILKQMDILKAHAVKWRQALLPQCNLIERLGKALDDAPGNVSAHG